MDAERAHKIWSDYYERIQNRRIAEAELLWSRISNSGVQPSKVLALDFVHFAEERQDADNLANQLRENYTVELVKDEDTGYWLVKSTTRPYGVSLDQATLAEWVKFMCDVAQSYHAVFSTFAAADTTHGLSWSSEFEEASGE